MSEPFVDTDVLVRLVTGDDPRKQNAARLLFRQIAAGVLTLEAPDTVIADAVFVLSSPRLYALPRADIRDILVPLVGLPGFRVRQRRVVLRALDVYASTRLDFGDAMLVASMEETGASSLYSYDRDFDRVTGVNRLEP